MISKLVTVVFAMVAFYVVVSVMFKHYCKKMQSNDCTHVPFCPHCGFADFYATDFMDSECSDLHICSYCRSLIHIDGNGLVEIKAADASTVFPQAITTPLVYYGTDGFKINKGNKHAKSKSM